MIILEGDEKLKNIGDLADRIGVSRDYIMAMKRDGFPMPGNKAFIHDAHKWLLLHPDFSVTIPLPGEKRRSLLDVDKYD